MREQISNTILVSVGGEILVSVGGAILVGVGGEIDSAKGRTKNAPKKCTRASNVALKNRTDSRVMRSKLARVRRALTITMHDRKLSSGVHTFMKHTDDASGCAG